MSKRGEEIMAEVRAQKKANKKLSTKWVVIITIITTIVMTAGLIFAGVKTYEFIYNKGIQDEKNRQALVVSEVAKTVEQLKLNEQ